jgi:hypothetical protein
MSNTRKLTANHWQSRDRGYTYNLIKHLIKHQLKQLSFTGQNSSSTDVNEANITSIFAYLNCLSGIYPAIYFFVFNLFYRKHQSYKNNKSSLNKKMIPLRSKGNVENVLKFIVIHNIKTSRTH